MNVIHLGRKAGENYEIRIGHDEFLELDFLMRRYSDGHTTISTRPGRDRTDLTWSPEYSLDEVGA